jgi:hypothetical protein
MGSASQEPNSRAVYTRSFRASIGIFPYAAIRSLSFSKGKCTSDMHDISVINVIFDTTATGPVGEFQNHTLFERKCETVQACKSISPAGSVTSDAFS